MKIQQLSAFIENKPGRLHELCRVLADANISILTLALADTEQFGILRLMVKEWQRAKDILSQHGFVVNVTEVVATEVKDEPGGLARILGHLNQAGISIEYMYAFTVKRNDFAVMVFKFDPMDRAVEVLQKHDIQVLKAADFYRMAG